MSAALGSSAIEVAIGLAFLYLLLSLLATVINEIIAQLTQLRARMLEQGLAHLLEGTASTAEATTLAEQLAGLRLPQSALGTSPESNKTAQARRPSPTAATLLNHPLIVSLKSADRRLSYIPARQFATAVLDVVAPELRPDSPQYVWQLRKLVAEMQGYPHLQQTLLTLIDQSNGDIHELRKSVENWFNDAMDRVSGWYKRKTAKILFVVGLLLAALVNADTLGIAQTLWTNPATRTAVVAAAQDYVTKQPTPTASSASATPGPFASQTKRLSDDVTTVQASQLPLGWPMFPPQPQDIARELLGLLLTTLAISLGAPFWFDALSKLVNVRSSGPVSSANDETDTSRSK